VSPEGDADADEFLEVSGRMARLADGYENAFGTSQTSGALRRASRMLAQATKYLPRPDVCAWPPCQNKLTQPAVGHPQEYCSKRCKKKKANALRKEREAEAEAAADAIPGAVDPSSRGVRRTKGRLRKGSLLGPFPHT
jgi:hypothetical protein